VLRNEANVAIEVSSNSLVAYAPYDDPKIAISCMAPYYVADRIVENGCSAMVEEAINAYAKNH
jgi:cell division protein FtsI/penicillin-binding protein 2